MYPPQGSCENDECKYSPMEIECVDGCFDGECAPPAP